MSVMVRIPTPLRRMTNGKDKVEVESDNLGDLVEKLNSEFPGFKDRLVDEEGELRYFVNIYLNGEDVRFMDGLNTSTSSGDEISIVPRSEEHTSELQSLVNLVCRLLLEKKKKI